MEQPKEDFSGEPGPCGPADERQGHRPTPVEVPAEGECEAGLRPHSVQISVHRFTEGLRLEGTSGSVWSHFPSPVY